jgi:hypothetical protein
MCGKPGKGRHGTSHHAKAIYQIKKSEYTKGATEAVLEEGQRIRWPDEK